MKQKAVEELMLEEAMAELEQLSQQMEQQDITMERSMELYERGLLLAKHCRQKLEAYQKRIAILENGQETPLEGE